MTKPDPKRRRLHSADRERCAQLARDYRAGAIDADALAGWLDVLAEDGNFAIADAAVNHMLEGHYAVRLAYKAMRARGVAQLEAIEHLVRKFGYSERTVRGYIYRKPKATP